MYGTRKAWDLEALDVDVRYDVNGNGGISITRIVTVPANFTAEQRQRLADIADRTSVPLTVRTGKPITPHSRDT
jgi:putative redox protein